MTTRNRDLWIVLAVLILAFLAWKYRTRLQEQVTSSITYGGEIRKMPEEGIAARYPWDSRYYQGPWY